MTRFQDIETTLQTEEAQFHLRGRERGEKRPIYGLLTFGRILAGIQRDCLAGSDVAKIKLSEVEKASARAQAQLEEIRTELNDPLDSAESILVKLSGTRRLKPQNEAKHVSLRFTATQAYSGAALLKDLDTLIIDIRTCESAGTLTYKQANKLQSRAIRAVRSLFHSVSDYKPESTQRH